MSSIQQLLLFGQEHLKDVSSSARLDAELILAFVLQQNRTYLYTYPEQKPTRLQEALFADLIAQRYQGRPIAYITGHKEFWSLDLEVNEATLIPRPETELLVELALQLLPQHDNLEVLDLGTGSGAIALALAHERPHWKLKAIDKSHQAIEVAKRNASRLNISNIEFLVNDWLEHFPQGPFAAILSNPPYIEDNDPHLQQGDLRFEPQSALVSGQNGLKDIQYIMHQSINNLIDHGILLLEHGYNQKMQIASILNKLGYTEVSCWQDWQGNDRVSGGIKVEKPK